MKGKKIYIYTFQNKNKKAVQKGNVVFTMGFFYLQCKRETWHLQRKICYLQRKGQGEVRLVK